VQKGGGNPPPFYERGNGVKFLELLDRFTTLLVAVVRWFCIVVASALFIIVVVAVIARYGFGQAVSWTEEVPRYLLIWISFLTAAVGVLNRDHVGFDVLFNALPKPVRRVLGVTLSALILMFGWIVFRYGITFVLDFGDDLMETIPYTNNWYYPAMPICGFLIMVFAFKLMVDEMVRPEAAAITGTSVD
jgi:TRAP-type C4-dicarboxylate transport system permease small subunit